MPGELTDRARKVSRRLRSIARRIWPAAPRPLILMYHRIADEPLNYSGLAVSPRRFQEQLYVLRRTRHPLPLTRFVERLVAGTLPPNAVAVTFDDGYVDNLVVGKPHLMAAELPATVFLTTGYIDRPERRFWWDELARFMLIEEGPQSFELVVSGRLLQFDLDNEWSARREGTNASLTKRRAALSVLRAAMRPLEEQERQQIVAKLRSIFVPSDYSASRAMTSAEVRLLIADGLVTIGAHTVNHPLLPTLKAADCHREIIESKRACEDLVGAPVMSFAYPYGDFDTTVREAVRQAGFTFACAVQSKWASITSDVFALPRVPVFNWDGDTFEQALRSASAVQ